MENKKFDLEDRLVKFACMCLAVCDLLPNSKTGQNLEYQLSKSATASALVYGEAQAAESKADFIHKIKVVLKEIRESRINLRIIIEKPILHSEKVQAAYKEVNELMAIFLKSVETAKQNKITSTFKLLISYFLFLISYYPMITKATINNIPQLVTLINTAYRGEESKKGWTTEADLLEGKRVNADGLEKIIQEPGSVILKYGDENNLTGCVYLKKNDNKMYLGMLTVSPTLQAGGIGKQILKAAEEYAAEQGCHTIEMTVISVRNELIAWYNRHGYHDTGKRSPFPDDALSLQKQPLEFITMEKSLK